MTNIAWEGEMKRSIVNITWSVIILILLDYLLKNIRLGNSLFSILSTLDNILILLFIPISFYYGYKVGLYSLLIITMSIVISALISTIPTFGSSQIDSGMMFLMNVKRYDAIGLTVILGIAVTSILHQFTKKLEKKRIVIIGTFLSFVFCLVLIIIQSYKVRSMYDDYKVNVALSIYDIFLFVIALLSTYILLGKLDKKSEAKSNN